MKASKNNNVLEGIKKEQLKRCVFTLEFKAEVVRGVNARHGASRQRGQEIQGDHRFGASVTHRAELARTRLQSRPERGIDFAR